MCYINQPFFVPGFVFQAFDWSGVGGDNGDDPVCRDDISKSNVQHDVIDFCNGIDDIGFQVSSLFDILNLFTDFFKFGFYFDDAIGYRCIFGF